MMVSLIFFSNQLWIPFSAQSLQRLCLTTLFHDWRSITYLYSLSLSLPHLGRDTQTHTHLATKLQSGTQLYSLSPSPPLSLTLSLNTLSVFSSKFSLFSFLLFISLFESFNLATIIQSLTDKRVYYTN